SPSLIPGASGPSRASAAWRFLYQPSNQEGFALQPPIVPTLSERFQFQGSIVVEAHAAVSLARVPDNGCTPTVADEPDPPSQLAPALASLRPVGQIRDSFILAVNADGLWIIDQHVAHERVLFERVLKQTAAKGVESQRLLMPLIVELTPAQQAVLHEISD